MLNMRLLDVSVTYLTETLNNFYSNTHAVCDGLCRPFDGKRLALCYIWNNEETLKPERRASGVVLYAVSRCLRYNVSLAKTTMSAAVASSTEIYNTESRPGLAA